MAWTAALMPSATAAGPDASPAFGSNSDQYQAFHGLSAKLLRASARRNNPPSSAAVLIAAIIKVERIGNAQKCLRRSEQEKHVPSRKSEACDRFAGQISAVTDNG